MWSIWGEIEDLGSLHPIQLGPLDASWTKKYFRMEILHSTGGDRKLADDRIGVIGLLFELNSVNRTHLDFPHIHWTISRFLDQIQTYDGFGALQKTDIHALGFLLDPGCDHPFVARHMAFGIKGLSRR